MDKNPFKVRMNKQYQQVLSYYTKVLLPATRVQGKYIEMSKKGVYLLLKKNGVAIVKNGVTVTSNNFTYFKQIVRDPKFKFYALMSNYTNDGSQKFISSGPNRWINGCIPDLIKKTKME